jgi:hypothetical protein
MGTSLSLYLFTKNQTTLRGHALAVTSVALSPDGKRIVIGSYDRTLKGVGRHSRARNRHAQGAHRLSIQRGVQPGRKTDRERIARGVHT